MKNIRKKAVVIISSVFILFLWHFASLLLDAQIILPSPFKVLTTLTHLFTEKSFVKNVISTILRAFVSFMIIFLTGTSIGIVAGFNKVCEYFMIPFVFIFQATPVMSIILLAFIWFRTGTIPVFSAFLMAFPVMYIQVLNGVRLIDVKLLQMCEIYRIAGLRKLRHFTLPVLIPSLVTGAKQSLSMIWKVIIASEVLTLPVHGVGRSMQLAQIQLQTEYVFAWTIIAVILTVCGDRIFDLMVKKITARTEQA